MCFLALPFSNKVHQFRSNKFLHVLNDFHNKFHEGFLNYKWLKHIFSIRLTMGREFNNEIQSYKKYFKKKTTKANKLKNAGNLSFSSSGKIKRDWGNSIFFFFLSIVPLVSNWPIH